MIGIRYRNLRYRGYEAMVWWDVRSGFESSGKVIIADDSAVVRFNPSLFGDDPFLAFKDILDGHLEFCKEEGMEPPPQTAAGKPDRSTLVPLYPVFDPEWEWILMSPKDEEEYERKTDRWLTTFWAWHERIAAPVPGEDLDEDSDEDFNDYFSEDTDAPDDPDWTDAQLARSVVVSDYPSEAEAREEAEHLAAMQMAGMGNEELENYRDSRIPPKSWAIIGPS